MEIKAENLYFSYEIGLINLLSQVSDRLVLSIRNHTVASAHRSLCRTFKGLLYRAPPKSCAWLPPSAMLSYLSVHITLFSGGARRGLEGPIAPLSEHASPPRTVKSSFLEYFSNYGTLLTVL